MEVLYNLNHRFQISGGGFRYGDEIATRCPLITYGKTFNSSKQIMFI